MTQPVLVTGHVERPSENGHVERSSENVKRSSWAGNVVLYQKIQ